MQLPSEKVDALIGRVEHWLGVAEGHAERATDDGDDKRHMFFDGRCAAYEDVLTALRLMRAQFQSREAQPATQEMK